MNTFHLNFQILDFTLHANKPIIINLLYMVYSVSVYLAPTPLPRFLFSQQLPTQPGNGMINDKIALSVN